MINPFYVRKIGKPSKESKTDPQKQRVYKMEREWIGTVVDTTVPLDKLQGIANHACRKLKLKPPSVQAYPGRKGVREFGFSITGEIFLNSNFHGQNLSVLLHELAHYICDQKHPWAEPHGATYCGVYRKLLADYRVLPKEGFDAMAKKYKVSVFT